MVGPWRCVGERCEGEDSREGADAFRGVEDGTWAPRCSRCGDGVVRCRATTGRCVAPGRVGVGASSRLWPTPRLL